MTPFLIGAALLVVGALLLLVPPLFGLGTRRVVRHDTVGGHGQSATALAVLREQLADLEAEHTAGRISEEDYQRTREELERRALEDGQAPDLAPATQPARAWGVAVALAVPLLAVLLYLQVGTPDGLDPQKVAGTDRPQITQEQVEQMVASLAERLEREPDNVEGWYMLARSYNAMGRFSEAAKAYGELARRIPDEPQVYADWADALAAANDRRLAGEPMRLIDKALALDPDNIKALALAGSAAFQGADYAQAVAYWERILPQLPADNELAVSIREGIAEARARGGLPVAQAAPAGALSLAGTLALDPALAGAVSPQDVVFVFVRPVGGGMPFAILRHTVAELPLAFDFAGVPSMAGDRPIPAQVEIGARISRSGNAAAAAGDLEGAPQTVTPDASGLRLVIDSERAG